MNKKKLISRIITLLAFLSLSSTVFAQINKETESINKYLESTIEYSNKLLISGTSQKVLASDIIESSLTMNTGDENSYNTLQSRYFIKSKNKLTPYSSESDLLASPEFIESIKSKKFKLNTEDEGVAFQSMLALFDDERGLGFFEEDNIWYFIRSKFFDDIRAFVVTADKNGQISSVVYEDELKKTLPETLLKSGEIFVRSDSDETTISERDSAYMHSYLLDNLNYVFEISALDFYSLNKISSISINKCTMSITEETDGMSFTNNIAFMLVSNNNKYIKLSSIDDLLEMPLFLNSLQEKYTIKTEEDARLFQYVLDDLSPVSKSDIELKEFYNKDNMWFFVREKRFDDLIGYILVVDDKNKVSYVKNGTISEESIVRIKMRDPNFKVDYKFKLEKPATNKISLKRGEGLGVEISFDEDMANATGCWIMSRFDGQNTGMLAGTSIASPYTDAITGPSLEGQFHTVEYFLLENGGTDIKNALGVIKIDIEVK